MKKQKRYDPAPYDGPIERADGVRPFNGYLWTTEDWWAGRELGHDYSSSFHFGVIALADGRFATCGFVFAIEKNEYAGKPCVFATRREAIRSSAADLIWKARRSRSWPKTLYHKGVQGERLARLINWVREIVARETGAPAPRPIVINDPPPEPRKTGYPLLDLAEV